MLLCGGLIEEALDEPLYEIRCGLRCGEPIGSALLEDLPREGKGQRVAVCRREQGVVECLWDAALDEVGPALLRAQVAQREDAEQTLPVGIGAPGDGEGLSS